MVGDEERNKWWRAGLDWLAYFGRRRQEPRHAGNGKPPGPVPHVVLSPCLITEGVDDVEDPALRPGVEREPCLLFVQCCVYYVVLYCVRLMGLVPLDFLCGSAASLIKMMLYTLCMYVQLDTLTQKSASQMRVGGGGHEIATLIVMIDGGPACPIGVGTSVFTLTRGVLYGGGFSI